MKKDVNIFVCGDVVNSSNNARFIDDQLSRSINNADFAVCNLEGPEVMEGQFAICPHQGAGTIAYLAETGFDLLLLANNHITELGEEGVKRTIKTINDADVDYIGAGLSYEESYRPLEKCISGLNFGFINVCEAQVGQFQSKEQRYGYAWMGYEGLLSDIEKLAKKNDYVVVFVHAGLEHYNIPLPEIRDFYKRICSAGASVVVGGHPHSAQGWEMYEGSVIIYSLGNFYFPIREKWPDDNYSYSVLLSFNKDVNQIGVKPVYHYNRGDCVMIDSAEHVQLNRLNALLLTNYDLAVTEMVNHAWEKLCKRLIIESTCGQNEQDNSKAIARRIIDYTLFRKRIVQDTQKYRNSLLLRLFENESYRWCIIRYLKEKMKNYE